MIERKQNFNSICTSINAYYSDKIEEFGATARGVDWRDESSQELRFEQLVHILGPANVSRLKEEDCEVLDYGCGYGALLSFFRSRSIKSKYFGFDFSQSMIDVAIKEQREKENVIFSTTKPEQKVEFAFASGIFNVRLDSSSDAFHAYILSILDSLNEITTHGFSFNMLTLFSDKASMREDLHYENPGEILIYCLDNYSRTVNLSHGYSLFEFTVGVIKDQQSIGIRK